MQTVTGMLVKELNQMLETKEKRDKVTKSLKEVVFRGTTNGSQSGENDEIKELEQKLDSMDIPEEARKIYKQELKKLK